MEPNLFVTVVTKKDYHTPQRIAVVDADIKDWKTHTIPLTITFNFPAWLS